MRSATTQPLLLQALPLTEYGAKRVRRKVIFIALLLICLDFKVFEGELSITRCSTVQTGITTSISGSTVYKALRSRLYDYF